MAAATVATVAAVTAGVETEVVEIR